MTTPGEHWVTLDTQGLNDFGGTGYDAPCPPRGPAHRYFFRLYALDSALALPPY
jgi:hypothetical protein